MSDTMYFTGFGSLRYIEPEVYFKGNGWHYVCTEEGVDDKPYDIVRSDHDTEYYYTII